MLDFKYKIKLLSTLQSLYREISSHCAMIQSDLYTIARTRFVFLPAEPAMLRSDRSVHITACLC